MCCDETVEYSVSDGWTNGDVGGRKLRRLARSSQRGTLERVPKTPMRTKYLAVPPYNSILLMHVTVKKVFEQNSSVVGKFLMRFHFTCREEDSTFFGDQRVDGGRALSRRRRGPCVAKVLQRIVTGDNPRPRPAAPRRLS